MTLGPPPKHDSRYGGRRSVPPPFEKGLCPLRKALRTAWVGEGRGLYKFRIFPLSRIAIRNIYTWEWNSLSIKLVLSPEKMCGVATKQ